VPATSGSAGTQPRAVTGRFAGVAVRPLMEARNSSTSTRSDRRCVSVVDASIALRRDRRCDSTAHRAIGLRWWISWCIASPPAQLWTGTTLEGSPADRINPP
jgi:hypothetical protein